MKVCIPLLLITFLIALIVMPFAQASPGLNVTVTTDKPYYIPEESVNVNGTLTQNGVSVEDGLVALQVDDPYNTAVAVRTQQTGTTSTVGPIEIVEAFPCDPGTGFPKDSFQIKEFLGVNVVVNNTDSEPHYILVVVNAYDASGVTLGIGAGGGTILPGTQSSVTPGLSIPITAYTGNATAYASVYTDWPKNGGVPYCPEVSASYEIVGTGGLGVQGSAGPEAQNPTPGTYNITFKLSTNHKEGTYTAYATSSYGGENATASTTLNFEAAFPIVLAGQTFYILLETNSTLYSLSNFNFSETFAHDGWRGELSFSVTGPYNPSLPPTTGFCNITIPTGLMRGEPWLVLIDDISTDYIESGSENTSLYFIYTHTADPRKIQIRGTWVVPEFPTSTLLPILIIFTLAATILAQKTRLDKRRKTAAVR